MNVAELIALLEKVNIKSAQVFMEDSSKNDCIVHHVIIEHNLHDDEVVVVLKGEMT